MYEELIQAARAARANAYAPYSHFAVGAAVLAASGRVYSGCNVENASYGMTNCAERTAIFTAIAEGERHLTTLAVIADTPCPATPCGACRQVMAEFKIDQVIMCNTKGEQQVVSMAKLLPGAFTKTDLPGKDAADE
ncbi:MAG: cytidine deaminase [Negativicutes bacterium]|nr:cytidine deaminase [Negativicutes bacterium]